eukprot:TRINITY_DN94718_c0_g1_i1.p1 TRINITY_DN94718_c0_g1~~TRINITY_DN94718_c0_g1_i1.p1  ORF type:complete len:259 (+),score=2.16 TRINITY_DN94718_c0_g1_i1:45-821(+)
MHQEAYYWGKVDANIDWCEENYVVSPYVAEFWNTLSSLPIFLVSVYGLLALPPKASNWMRFRLSFICLGIVGLGSAMFHATLRRTPQLLDELPMLWCNMAFCFCLLRRSDLHPRNKNRRSLFPLMIWIHGIVTTFTYAILDWYPLFLFSYGSSVAVLTVWSARLSLCNVPAVRPIKPMLKRLFIMGFAFYFGGLVLWVLDNTLCEHVQSFHLHSLWHIGAGLGTYTFIVFTVVAAAPPLQVQPSLSFCGPLTKVDYMV